MKTCCISMAAALCLGHVTAQTLPSYVTDASLATKNSGKMLWETMAYIPGGTFTAVEPNEDDGSIIVTHSAFFIQKKEVTNRWYRAFLYRLAQTNRDSALKMLPDTAAWENDFKYAYNEPMKRLYFCHAAYDNYPVVGVNYWQAQAFAAWANTQLQQYLAAHGVKQVPVELRLPTSVEWQYAAMGGLENACYGLEAKDPAFGNCTAFTLYDPIKRKFRGNYKNDEGYFIADKFFHTAPVGSFEANAYGLFDMVGNVSEWTMDAYRERLEDPIPAGNNTRKLPRSVKGGSWKDDHKAQYVNRSFAANPDSGHCYIGFRLAAGVEE